MDSLGEGVVQMGGEGTGREILCRRERAEESEREESHDIMALYLHNSCSLCCGFSLSVLLTYIFFLPVMFQPLCLSVKS